MTTRTLQRRPWRRIASSLGLLLSSLLATACPVSIGFRGPGYDAKRGVIHPDAGERVVVSLTRASLHAQHRGPFDEQIWVVEARMDEHEGLVGYSIGKELLGGDVWTQSVWVDEASLDRFVRSQVHQHAIGEGRAAIDTIETHRFEWPTSEVPLSWDDAFAILDAEGQDGYGPPASTATR